MFFIVSILERDDTGLCRYFFHSFNATYQILSWILLACLFRTPLPIDERRNGRLNVLKVSTLLFPLKIVLHILKS